MPKMSRRGFTILELLVVLAIIGVMAAVVMAFLGGVKEKSKDTKRKRDIHEIRTAINLHYNAEKKYPYDPSLPNGTTINITGDDVVSQALEPEHMREVPVDPLNDSVYIYQYVQMDNGTNYKLLYCRSDMDPLTCPIVITP